MLEPSAKAKDFRDRLLQFMDDHIYPNEERVAEHMRTTEDRWQPIPVIEVLKPKAMAAGLWNMFLPESVLGPGLNYLVYAPLCEILGRV
jgi:acyl-CoA dehydrogenase